MTQSYPLSQPLKTACTVAQISIVIVAILSVWIFFAHDIIDQSLEAYWARVSPEAREVIMVSELKKNMLVLIATVAFFAPGLILFGAFRVFRAFRRGSPFREETVRSVRFLGTTIIIYAVSKIVSYSSIVLMMTYDNPPGLKEFTIAIDTHTLVTLMIGLIILIIGQILVEAMKIAEENEQFV